MRRSRKRSGDRFPAECADDLQMAQARQCADRSHTPHRLQTTLTPAQEAVAVALLKALLVSLDDLLALAIVLEPMAHKARSASS